MGGGGGWFEGGGGGGNDERLPELVAVKVGLLKLGGGGGGPDLLELLAVGERGGFAFMGGGGGGNDPLTRLLLSPGDGGGGSGRPDILGGRLLGGGGLYELAPFDIDEAPIVGPDGGPRLGGGGG